MKKNQFRQTFKQLLTMAVTTCTVAALTLTVAATSPNYGRQLGQWILSNMAWFILVIGICSAAYMGIKRNFVGALITFCITALAFVIMLNAEAVLNTLGGVLRGILGL